MDLTEIGPQIIFGIWIVCRGVAGYRTYSRIIHRKVRGGQMGHIALEAAIYTALGLSGLLLQVGSTLAWRSLQALLLVCGLWLTVQSIRIAIWRHNQKGNDDNRNSQGFTQSKRLRCDVEKLSVEATRLLQQAPPRKISIRQVLGLRPGSTVLPSSLGFGFLVLGGLLLVRIAPILHDRFPSRNGSVSEMEAVVVRTEYYGSEPMSDDRWYEVTFSYSVTGTSYTGSSIVLKQDVPEVGDSTSIVCWGDGASRAELADCRSISHHCMWKPVVFPSFLVLLGLVGVAISGWSFARLRRVLEAGVVGRAEIIDVRRRLISSINREAYAMDVHLTHNAMQEDRLVAVHVSGQRAIDLISSKYAAKETLSILYEPSNPENVLILDAI